MRIVEELMQWSAASVVDSLLIAARLIPIALLVPCVGLERSRAFRLVVAVAMTAALLPILSPTVAAALTLPSAAPIGDSSAASAAVPVLAVLAIREVALGATLGFAAALPFHAAYAAFGIMDTVWMTRGTAAHRLDQANSTTLLARFALLLTVMLFFSTGGHLLFLRAVAFSYHVWPIGSPLGMDGTLPGHNLGDVIAAVPHLIRRTGQLLAAAVGMAAPILTASFLADLIVGLAGRSDPQLPSSSVVFLVRGLVVIVVVCLAMPSIAALIAGQGASAAAALRDMLDAVTSL